MATKKGPTSTEATPQVDKFIADLASKNQDVRIKARNALVELGPESVDALAGTLKSPDWHVRWEAAFALGGIKTRASMDALANALCDDNFDVRWMAAERLAGFGLEAAEPLLQALNECGESSFIHRPAHWVFRHIMKIGLEDELKPVIAALEGVEPPVQAPWAAKKALEKLGSRR